MALEKSERESIFTPNGGLIGVGEGEDEATGELEGDGLIVGVDETTGLGDTV